MNRRAWNGREAHGGSGDAFRTGWEKRKGGGPCAAPRGRRSRGAVTTGNGRLAPTQERQAWAVRDAASKQAGGQTAFKFKSI
jgi:hypothetical protein